MKYTLIFLWFIQATLLSSVCAQVYEDFSDGDFTNSPAWSGDISNFIVNGDGQLQLSAPAEVGQSILVTESEIINNAEWSFYVKMEFNPSSSNYVDVYLVSDDQDLTRSLNGYFVRIGNAEDEVSLYKQSGVKSDAQKIIDGVDDRLDSSQVEIWVQVIKDTNNQWELLVDTGLSGNFISEGKVIDSDHFFSTYFGLFCKYTSTRSDRFYFDDISITGEAYSDMSPPFIDTITVQNDSVLQVSFNESIQAVSATDPNNYLANNGLGNPSSINLISDKTIELVFKNKFEDKIENQILISNIRDLFENSMDDYTTNFTYYAPYLVQFGDLIVSEIFADPSPQLDLPEYEFLELFNSTSQRLQVFDMYLVVGADSIPLPEFTMEAGQYLILCQSAAVDEYENLGNTMKVPNWPTLNNRGERVSLYNAEGNIIFTIDYNDSWYQSIEKEDGGWSLEMIDTNFPCKGRENWKASEEPSGGTPGKENASKDQLADLTAPEIMEVIVFNNYQLLIQLTEKLPPSSFQNTQVSIEPNLAIQSIMLDQPDLDKIHVVCSDSMQSNIEYLLTLKNITDCAGNHQSSTTSVFIRPESADSLDIIINEILFDPWPGGVDFVELYNQSGKYIDLKDWLIANKDTTEITTKHYIFKPGHFLVLTEDYDILNNHYPGIKSEFVLKVDRLTAFNNDEGKAFLIHPVGKIIDYITYSEDMHSPFLSDPEGVSLERISFSGESKDPDNWQSAAETFGFATPGEMNSQHYSGQVNSDEVIVEPKIFSPGNFGTNNFTLIKCRFDQPGNMANIRVLDVAGREIRTIASHQAIGTEEDFKWEGENNKGEEVRMGHYIVYVELYNAQGMTKIYRKKVVVGGRM
jgi:hypothetical protein